MDIFGFIKSVFLQSFLLIFSLVLFLCLDDPYENIFLSLFIISLILMIKSIKKVELSFYRVISLILLFVILYFVSITFLYTKSYSMNLKIDDFRIEKNGKAVLLVYEGESERYSLTKSIKNIQLKEKLSYRIKGPLLLYQSKTMYKRIGKSDYKQNTEDIKERLKEILNEEFAVYIGYLFDTNYVEEAIFQIVNDGYQDIIVVPVLLTDNDKLTSLKNRIETLKLFNLNVRVKYTDTLWNSEAIVNSYIDMITKYINSNSKEDSAVVLIGESSENHNDIGLIESVKQNMMFMKKIEDSLINNIGLGKSKVRISWIDFIQPYYLSELRSLFEYGVGNILCIYIKPSVTNIENSFISKEISHKLDVPEKVRIKIIDGFLKDDIIIEELKRRIEFVNLQKWD